MTNEPRVRVREPGRGLRILDVQELIDYKDLFFFMVWRDVKVLYKQTVLGFGWAILRPVFSMIIFSVIFGRLAHVPSDGVPYPIFSFVALVPWTYFQTAMAASSNSLITGSRLVSRIYFPRVILPLSPVFSGLVDFVIALSIVAIMMAAYGIAPTRSALALPLLVLIMALTAAGVGVWFSALAVQYRDFRFGMPFLAQILMYAAPVVWPVSLIPDRYRLVYGLYPMAGVIEGFRSALLGTNPMPWDLIAIGAAAAAILFVSGLVFFRKMERFVADVA